MMATVEGMQGEDVCPSDGTVNRGGERETILECDCPRARDLLPPRPTRGGAGGWVAVVVGAARQRKVDTWYARHVGPGTDRGWLVDDGARDEAGNFAVGERTCPETDLVELAVDAKPTRTEDAN